MATATTAAQVIIPFPVVMRTIPSSLDFSNIHVSDLLGGQTATALTIGDSTILATKLIATVASGLTTYRPAFLLTDNNVGSYLGLSAEL